MRHVYWLIAVLVVLGVANVFLYAGILPAWYSVLILAVGVVGVFVGGRLSLRRERAAADEVVGRLEDP